MSRIRSKGNKSTEVAFARVLRRRGTVGWRRHVRVAGVSVDFVLPRERLAIFVDGCFWHMCPYHCRTERLSPYWLDKVRGNWNRDRAQETLLDALGWNVVRV